jgi:hypothetical protein
MSFTQDAFEMMSKPSFWTSEGFLTDDLANVVEVVGNWIQNGVNATKNGTNPAGRVLSGKSSLLQEGSYFNEVEALFKSGYVKKLQVDASAEIAKEKRRRHLEMVQTRKSLHEAHASRHLFRKLLGGSTMAKVTLTPAEWESSQAGVAAAPETLEFAEFLAANATLDAAEFLHGSAQYSGTSSNHLDAFANEIKSFCGKTSLFLTTTRTYSGQKGIDFLKTEANNFIENAEAEILAALEPKISMISKSVATLAKREGKPLDGNIILKQVEKELDKLTIDEFSNKMSKIQFGGGVAIAGEPDYDAMWQKFKVDYQKHYSGDEEQTRFNIFKSNVDIIEAHNTKNLSYTLGVNKFADQTPEEFYSTHISNYDGQKPDDDKVALKFFATHIGYNNGQQPVDDPPKVAFEEMKTLLQDLMALLPSAAQTINEARNEVVQVAHHMRGVFGTFGISGPTIFNEISWAYKFLWTVYFIMLMPVLIGTLWYAMWASGWMGGPASSGLIEETEEEAMKPRSFSERLSICYSACCLACSRCQDNIACFWSCLIIYQIVVLVVFIAAVMLCLVAGVKMFFLASCEQIYMLNQADMCTNALQSVQSFVQTFMVETDIPIEETCASQQLLLCDLIGSRILQSTMYTTVFSFLAAIIQFQLVVESAVLHERARMRKIVEHIEATNQPRSRGR